MDYDFFGGEGIIDSEDEIEEMIFGSFEVVR